MVQAIALRESLFNEVRLLLHEELTGEADAYTRVLQALASGHHHRRDVAAACGLTLAATQHYWNDLLSRLGPEDCL